MLTAARAVFDGLGQVAECGQDVVGPDVGQAKGSDAGGIDDPARRAQRQRHRLGGGVTALTDSRHLAGRTTSLGNKTVHQGRLADPGMAEQRGEATRQDLHDGCEWFIASRPDDSYVEVCELRRE
ncbi:Uncharacterised protein [Mycobacteroides abscessus subsp. abscessus]|nr:Uncharacterised protein [Mycobacteroides abscessus subsp. abscessus]